MPPGCPRAGVCAPLIAAALLLVSAPPWAEASPGRGCEREVIELRPWLRQVAPGGDWASSPVLGRLGVRLVPFAGDPPQPLTHLEMVPGRLALNGEPYRPADGPPVPWSAQLMRLHDELRILFNHHGLVRPNEPFPGLLTVAVDAAVPWEEIVAVSQTILKARHSRILWLFAKDLPRPARPPRSAIDAALAALPPPAQGQKRAKALADLLLRVLSPCDGVSAMFTELSGLPLERKAPALAELLPGVLERCGCSLDMAAARAAVYAFLWLSPGTRAVSTVETRIAGPEHADARELSLAAATPWSKAHRAIVAAAGNPGHPALRLGVR